jgi:hypothetical protein
MKKNVMMGMSNSVKMNWKIGARLWITRFARLRLSGNAELKMF